MGFPIADDDMKSLLDKHRKETMLLMACCHVGIIQAFDTSNQTASVQIVYKRLITGAYVDFPILVDCPVFILGGKDHYLEMPIKIGDECLVIFNDRDIDNWFASGNVGPLNSQRLHSISDGFALVGVRSLKNSISSYENDRVGPVQGSVEVTVGTSKIRVKNTTKNLLGVINALQSIVNQQNTALTALATTLTSATTFVDINTAGSALTAALTPITALLTAYPTTESGALLE